MGLNINWETKIIEITSPTTNVDAQTLHDFIEDNMATAVGMGYDDIIKPEGKVEDPSNPGVFSQIIIILNSPWQIQFWGGSGYTRIYGGKIVGGLSDEPIKATGTAGDVTVLESPVDGLTVATGAPAESSEDIADAVWDELQAGHNLTGSFGEFLDSKVSDVTISGSIPTSEEIADAVWDEVSGEHISIGTLGKLLEDILEDTSTTIPGLISTMQINVTELLGLTGENVKWSNITHDANNLMTAARITLYTDNTLVTPVKSWDVTATYNGDGEITSYQMIEV